MSVNDDGNVTWFTIHEARALMPRVYAQAEIVITTRAELAYRMERLNEGEKHQLPEVKALEAKLSEALDWFQQAHIQVKGYAPLLIDFPMHYGERTLLLCWLENEPELAWYHDEAHGFLGRRPLSDLGL
jgi:hypothetical protein